MLTDAQESELIETWITTRDNTVREKLIKAFEPLVMKYARGYANYGISKDELIAVGNLALVETTHRFKPEMGFKFSTYSGHWIRGMMLIFIASNYFSITLKSQKMKHIFFSLRKLMHNAQKDNEGENFEIMSKMAEHFGCSTQELEQIYQIIRQPNCSLNDPIRSNNADVDGTIGDTICTEDPGPEEQLIKKSQDNYHRRLIFSMMKRVLNERERTIIQGQLLLEEGRTLQDLADEFKLSRERVRQIRNTAYEKLQKAIRARCDTETHNLF